MSSHCFYIGLLFCFSTNSSTVFVMFSEKLGHINPCFNQQVNSILLHSEIKVTLFLFIFWPFSKGYVLNKRVFLYYFLETKLSLAYLNNKGGSIYSICIHIYVHFFAKCSMAYTRWFNRLRLFRKLKYLLLRHIYQPTTYGSF